MPDDGYAPYYANRIWQLLPAIYRSLDTGTTPSSNPGANPGAPGPLQELVNRIGAQAAVVRRSIDRLGENQSIETCDDWVIPYIGDLLATRLVSCLDAAAQRIDVAKTIYYRRRAGTLGLLEELAADIATRDARVVEFFRRLSRTRHQFDPPIATWQAADPAADWELSIYEGLRGAYTGTPAGGFADLRNAYGASNTGTAFDEYAYTADLRTGGESTGWYNISHLGVFIWWLYAFPIVAATPVSNSGGTCFTFDPTGRGIPLFAPSQRSAEAWGENWVSPSEWELPVPIRELLWKTVPQELYPNAFWVGTEAGGVSVPVGVATVSVHPDKGLFSFVGAPPSGPFTVGYSFGFSSKIGAGGFDYGILATLDPPANTVPVSGFSTEPTPATALDKALGSVAANTLVQINDSLTYNYPNTDPADTNPDASFSVPGASSVFLQAESGQRPVLRWTSAPSAATLPTWTMDGQPNPETTGAPTVLVIQGIHVQGADIVLTGSFDTVYLRMVTFDPGTAGVAPALFGDAIDGLALRPSTLWIEAAITNLMVERSITGPIRTRNGGAVQTLTASDSIIQSIPTQSGGPAGPALEFIQGSVSLSRCTVMGPTQTHQLSASESILDDVATVENAQAGCVRFSAYATGSTLHQPYRSVQTEPLAGLFLSRMFGSPDYARLRGDADSSIVAPATGGSILQGAQNGAEMGAFCLEQIALLKRGLSLKYQEFMPIGQLPVWIDVVE